MFIVSGLNILESYPKKVLTLYYLISKNGSISMASLVGKGFEIQRLNV